MALKLFSAEWFAENLPKDRGAQADLFRHMHRSLGDRIDRTKVNKMVRGKRQPQRDEIPLIWEFLRLDPNDLALAMRTGSGDVSVGSLLPAPNAGFPERVALTGKLPILGGAVAGFDGRFVMNGTRIGEVACPRGLDDVPNAYAVYVHGTSMEDRYFAGEIVFVDPNRPVRQNDYVVAQVYNTDNEPAYGFIKQFVSFGASELVLRQLNPPDGDDEIMRFPRTRVVSVHRIVGTLTP